MRYGIIAEGPLERIGLASGLVPTPMLEPYGAAFGRTLMVATKLGVFDVLADAPLSPSVVAERCGIDARAAEKVMNLLVGMRYLRHLGTEAYDLVLAFSLVHHFGAQANLGLAARCAQALRPGGLYVIGDQMRPESPSKASAQDLFFDLYFSLTSRSGLWSSDEMAAWQRAAGLEPRKPIRLFMGQGPILQIGERPSAPA